MALGNASPVLSSIPKREVAGVWTGGGSAANCTKAAADWSKGISSVAYNAATGKYRITLSDFGQQLLPGSRIDVCRAAGASPIRVNIIRSSLAPSAATGTATLDFEVWQDDAVSGIPALLDLLTTDKLLINLVFATAAFG